MQKIILILFIMFLSITPRAEAAEDAKIYSTAKRMAKSGQTDFAFMQYQRILRDHPTSRFAEPAWFALGEYNFLMGKYVEAREAFRTFLGQYPDSKGKLFALAYLQQVAQRQDKPDDAREIEMEMIKYKQVSLVFRDRKEFKYQSPLKNYPYKAAIHIDKIEIYAGGELFAKISY